jgi:hypothetical protein
MRRVTLWRCHSRQGSLVILSGWVLYSICLVFWSQAEFSDGMAWQLVPLSLQAQLGSLASNQEVRRGPRMLRGTRPWALLWCTHCAFAWAGRQQSHSHCWVTVVGHLPRWWAQQGLGREYRSLPGHWDPKGCEGVLWDKEPRAQPSMWQASTHTKEPRWLHSVRAVVQAWKIKPASLLTHWWEDRARGGGLAETQGHSNHLDFERWDLRNKLSSTNPTRVTPGPLIIVETFDDIGSYEKEIMTPVTYFAFWYSPCMVFVEILCKPLAFE